MQYHAQENGISYQLPNLQKGRSIGQRPLSAQMHLDLS
jgi:hypothetical protein